MRVSPDSPVQDQNSYLYKWDQTARKYFNHFEIHKQGAKQGLRRLYSSIFTSWRDPIQYRHRIQDIDIITYKQLLGDISKEEVQEVNQAQGVNNGTYFLKSRKEPATITGWKYIPLAAYWALGAGIAGYALLIKKYNILWTFAPFVPLWVYVFYQWSRQPTQEIENAYKYILAKRAATCEFEKNKKKFTETDWAQKKQFRDLEAALRSRDITLYQLENELIEKINSNQFK